MKISKDDWNRLYDEIFMINNFNGATFVNSISFVIKQNAFFNNCVAQRQTGNPSTSLYKPKVMPKVGQVAYFNLTEGFPKELQGGHWCYIVSKFKTKFLVIPCTSVKDTRIACDNSFQMKIKIKEFINNKEAKLQLSDIRAIDIQRLYAAKGFYDVETNRSIIINKVHELLT